MPAVPSTPRFRVAAALLASAAVLAPAAPAVQAAPAPRKVAHGAPNAPCDEVKGITQLLTARWRLFFPKPVASVTDSGILMACRRGPSPATQLLDLGGFAYPGSAAGDLVQLSNSGHYGLDTIAVDLATGTFTDLNAADSVAGQQVLGSGAIAEIPVTTETATDGFDNQAFAAFGADDTPGAGFYTTAADGSVVRTVPPVDDLATLTAGWQPLNDKPPVPHRYHAAPASGSTITPLLGRGLQVEQSYGRGGVPGPLALTFPGLVAFGERGQTKVVAQLAPGSAADVRVFSGTLIEARFADRPDERRIRFLFQGLRKSRVVVDLPAPPATVVNPVAFGNDEGRAIATGDTIALLQWKQSNGRRVVKTIAAPGADDVALVESDTTDVVYWTDPAGMAHRVAVPRPA